MKKDKSIHRLLLPIDLEIIFNGGGAWNMFYSILYHTGLRANDVASLKYGNIDFKKESIIRLVRKNRRVHEFPIADVLINMIDRKADEFSSSLLLLIIKRLMTNWLNPENKCNHCLRLTIDHIQICIAFDTRLIKVY